MKKKIMGRKIAIVTILGLTCVTAIGVGFAAWAIGQEDSISDVGNISAKVDDIVDSRFSAKITMDDASINFGPKVGSNKITSSSGENEEDLNFAFTLTFTPRDETSTEFPKIAEGVNYSISYEFTNKLHLDSYGDSNKNFVVFPEKTTIATLSSAGIAAADGITITSAPTYSDEASSILSGYTLTYTGSLAWGTVFQSMNPSDNSNLSDSDVTATVKNLQELSSILSNAGEDSQLEITAYVDRVISE